MALGGLLGGGGADPFEMYGDLFTDKQKAAIREQQSGDMLARLAAAAAKAAEPSPVKRGMGQVLGLLGGAMGGSQDEAINRQLKAMQLIEEVKSKRQQRGFAQQVAAVAQQLMAGGVPAPVANREATRIVESGSGGGGPPGAPAAPDDNAPPPPPDTVGEPFPAPGPWSLSVPPRPQSVGIVPSRLPYRGYGAPPAAAENASDYGPQAGLLPPPDQAVGPTMAQGPGVLPQLAALYEGGGGESGAPFRLAGGPGLAGDTGLPDLGRVNVELLSGQAAPAGGVAMPFPTIQDPNKPKSAWAQGYTYDQPRVPYGQDPSDRVRPGGGSEDDRLAALTRKYESGDRNIRQQVNATGTAGGYYQITDPTWRDIAPRAGIDLEKYPRALDAPREVQDAAAKALRETRGMQPWQSNRPLMAAVGGLPNAGRVRVEPLGGEAAPAPAAGAGRIPGLNMTPEQLAGLNMMAKIGGLGEPFGSLLDTYYKSPGYLAEKTRTEEVARKEVAQKYDPIIAEQTEIARKKVEFDWKPKIDEAVAKLQSPILKEREQAKADIDRYSEEIKQNRNAALTPTDATVVGPDMLLTTQKITALEFARRQQARAERAAKNDTSIQPGDIVGTPTGTLPQGYQHRITPEGKIEAGAVPNTPAAREEAEAVEKKKLDLARKQTSTDFVTTDIDRVRQKIQASPFTTTGVVGGWLSGINETDAGFIRNAIEGIESNIMLDRMLALKAASPTGATGMGSLTEKEGERLVKAYGSLKQSQGTAEVLYNLDRVQRLYLEFIHGPVVAQEMMANRPTEAGPSAAKGAPAAGDTTADPAKAAYDRLPPGSQYTDPNGVRRTKPGGR